MAYEVGEVLPAAAMRGLAERWLPGVVLRGQEQGGDFLCSPVGLWLALAAVAAGARGETAVELRELLGCAGPDAARAVTGAARALADTDSVGVATRVWSGVPVLREYREALPGVGFGDMDPEAADAWVRDVTGGLIERLPVAVTPDTLLLLVNALALKARWEDPFEGAGTRDAAFTDAAGRVHQVPTMRRGVAAGDAWVVDGAVGGRVRVVEMRCASTGGRAPVRVRFVVGEPGAGADAVLPLGWAPRERRSAIDADRVVMALPRFSLRTRIDATEQLAGLGVRWAMSDAADFSGMSPERLAISQVVQEAVVKVAEEGVEAAAVTAVPMRPGGAAVSGRVEWVAFDRPFGVVVLDGAGEVPLFVGWQAGVPRGA
ncbi:serpin family protein [Streptomyces kanamyceticus]|uniref:Serine protease n=1 Tax=Streptomyces kanamyceticus TaxID=1967 RepID=A0A5J6GTV5_STRKN|nr:serpin family protein [Streptomyces kanamyceticus]QEU97681.1 serine protease [Streptomyces kanamyceticus]